MDLGEMLQPKIEEYTLFSRMAWLAAGYSE